MIGTIATACGLRSVLFVKSKLQRCHLKDSLNVQEESSVGRLWMIFTTPNRRFCLDSSEFVEFDSGWTRRIHTKYHYSSPIWTRRLNTRVTVLVASWSTTFVMMRIVDFIIYQFNYSHAFFALVLINSDVLEFQIVNLERSRSIYAMLP